MVIFADGFPEAWFGHRFDVKMSGQADSTVKIEGIVNGTTLLASTGSIPFPYMNTNGFARGLLLGVIRQIE